ncbi:hypothetical protein Tco_1250688 [Tanacetum coccineum]
MEETYYVTFSGDDEAISQSSTKGDVINFNEVKSFPHDEFLKPRSRVNECSGNTEYFLYVPAFDCLLINITIITKHNITPTDSPIRHHSESLEEPVGFTSVDDLLTLNEHDHPESAISLKLADARHYRWSREKHIELVNIIGKPLAGITTRSRVRDSEATSAYECLYVNFLFEMEPKKLIEAL